MLPRNALLVRLEDAGMAEQMIEYVCHAVLHRYREFDAYAEQQQSADQEQHDPLPDPLGHDVRRVRAAATLGARAAQALPTMAPTIVSAG